MTDKTPIRMLHDRILVEVDSDHHGFTVLPNYYQNAVNWDRDQAALRASRVDPMIALRSD